MPNTNKLYYKRPRGRIKYGVNPTGRLSIERLVRGIKDFWIKTGVDWELKPKKLIVSDWTQKNWSIEKFHKANELLQQLKQLGFSVYTYSSGMITPINKFTTKSIIELEFPENIIEQALKQKIGTRDELQVLDDYIIDLLLNESKQDMPKSIKISDYRAIDSDEIETFFEILKNSAEKLQIVLLDEFQYDALLTESLSQMEQAIPNIVFKYEYQKAIINATIINQFLHGTMNELTYTINENTFQFEKQDLHKISELIIKDRENSTLLSLDDWFVFLSEYCSTLRKLELDVAHIVFYELNLTPNSLPNLEEFKFSCTLVPFDSLSTRILLEAAPNLKTIYITERQPINCWMNSYDLLGGLEQIHYNYTNGTYFNIFDNKLLEYATNLRVLELNCCTMHDEIEVVKATKIEIIKWETVVVSISSVKLILKSNPNLKEFTLLSPTSWMDDLNLEANSLLALEKIKINLVQISSATFGRLLKAAPNINNLNINCKGNLGDLDLPPDSLVQLEEIHIANATITTTNLLKLLTATPNLKTIILGECKIVYEPGGASIPILEKLQVLKFENSIIPDADSANKILSCCCKAKDITLYLPNEELENLPFDLNVQNLNLIFTNTNLNSSINLLNFQKIILKSRLTKFLKPFFNGVPAGIIHYESWNLMQLERASLHECNEDFLHALFAAASNISTLEIWNNIHELESLKSQPLTTISGLLKLTIYNFLPSNILFKVLRAVPKLKVLSMSCYAYIDFLVENVYEDLEQISFYNYSNNQSVLSTLLQHSPNVTDLTIYYSNQEKKGALQLPPKSLCKLKEFSIPDTSGYFKTEDLKKLFDAAPNVTNCKIKGMVGKQLKLLPKSLNNLETITFEYCNEITMEQIVTLLAAAPHLKKLSIWRGSEISNEEYQKIKELYPNLDSECSHKYKTKLGTSITRESEQKPSFAFSDPKHNPEEFKHHKPTPPDFEFKHQNFGDSKNQKMIINQLCQYLNLKGQHLHYVPKLQDGICDALTQLFSELSIETWNAFIDSIAAWDGLESSINSELEQQFQRLWTYVKKYQLGFGKPVPTHYYLGDNISTFLEQANNTYRIANPWHVITIKPIATGSTWLVYDPNYPKGVKTVDKSGLKAHIKVSLGNLVSVEATRQQVPAKIENPALFIKEGGLIVLHFAPKPGFFDRLMNSSSLIEQIPVPLELNADELNGLFLRTNKGIPAWVCGIKSADPNIQELTYNLLQQAKQKIPNLSQEITDSLEEASEFLKHEIITQLPIQDEIKPSIRKKPLKNPYIERLQTWKKSQSISKDLNVYIQECFNQIEIRKRFIQLNSSSQLHAMQFALQNYCINTSHRPVFYADNPEDLNYSDPIITCEEHGNKGLVKEPPCGRFYEFLKQNHGKNPVVIINYEHFEPNDVARFNAILDDKNDFIPKDTLIIGLTNSDNPDSYKDSDLTGQFTLIEHCPVPGLQLEKALPSVPFIKKPPDSKQENYETINLFHSSSWKDMLLGGWTFKNGEPEFNEGLLAQALASGKPIEIQNGLWDTVEFQLFWQQAILEGCIKHDGRILTVPKDLQLIPTEGYSWNALCNQIKLETTASIHHEYLVLNSSLLNDFINRYICDNSTHTLNQVDGHVKFAKNKQIFVHVTSYLNQDEWALFLNECLKHNVKAHVYLTSDVAVPDELGIKPAENPTEFNHWDYTEPTHDQIVISTDIDTTVAMLADNKLYQIIDVSECSPEDLLVHVHPDIKWITDKEGRKKLQMHFNETKGALLTALESNKKVILKGDISKELADQLAPLLLQRQKSANNLGQVLIVCNFFQPFSYLPVTTHSVKDTDKLACLGSDSSPKLAPYLTTEPLSTLKARNAFWKAHPDEPSSDGLWDGMYDLQHAIKPLEPLNPLTSAQEAEAFFKARLDSVLGVLNHKPYVFLAGLSGVGKTTFVKKVLSKYFTIYEGKEQIKEMANDKSGKRKILFFDEITLLDSNLTQYEGINQNPPVLFDDGKLVALSPEDKLVFAGNPVSYGDERKLASLFVRHGNSLIFDPLPTCVLYETILKPVFENSALQSEAPELSKHFLEVYRFLVACSVTDVLITPRELQMMAIMTLSYCAKNRNSQPLDVGKHYAYTLAKNLVPQNYISEFEKKFKIDMPSSRDSIRNTLDELLDLRALRRQTSTNEVVEFGGLGGMIIEGNLKQGKKHLVFEALTAHGFQKITNYKNPATIENGFYFIEADMSLSDREALLCKACDEGMPVLIEKFNSFPLMEQLMNSLLMGHIPGKGRPKKPGFVVLGMQHPTSMSGRLAPSTALSRRLITEYCPDYTHQEMLDIIVNKGLGIKDAKLIVAAYYENVQKAKNERLSPEPTFKDVLVLVEDIIKARSKMPAKPLTQTRPYLLSTSEFVDENLKEQLKICVSNARAEYAAHHSMRKLPTYNRGYEHGFFSSLRHRPSGLAKASNLATDVQEANTAQEILEIIDNLLTQKNTHYHVHSFPSYLLDHITVILQQHNITIESKRRYTVEDWTEVKTHLQSMGPDIINGVRLD